MGNINSAIEQSSLPDPNPTFDTGLPIVNESNEDAKKVRYSISKAETTNNKRLRSTFCIEAIQTRSIARPLCDSRDSYWERYLKLFGEQYRTTRSSVHRREAARRSVSLKYCCHSRSLKVIRNRVSRKFLLVFHCNCVAILYHFWDIQRRIITTNATVAVVHRRPCWQHLARCSINSRQRSHI